MKTVYRICMITDDFELIKLTNETKNTVFDDYNKAVVAMISDVFYIDLINGGYNLTIISVFTKA